MSMDDLKIAKKYIGKADRARTDGYEFKISFQSFRNMMLAKYCKFTGIKLTEPSGPTQIASNRTIDRIDSSKGYVSGNVAAVCYAANKFKGMLENPNFKLTPDEVIKIAEMALEANKHL